jgi:hypothetical protein
MSKRNLFLQGYGSKKMNRKGQTEDVFAEFIISMIIIVVGIYVLGSLLNLQSVNFQNQKGKLDSFADNDVLSLGNYVNYEIVMVDGKEISFKELVRKAYTDENYKKELTSLLESKDFFFKNGKYDYFENFTINLSYPNQEIVYYYREGDIEDYDEDFRSISHEQVLLPLEDYKQVIISLDILQEVKNE